MKKYNIYLSDAPEQALTVNAKNKTEARQHANLYIKQWNLNTTVLRIEERK